VNGLERTVTSALVAFGRQIFAGVRYEYEATDGPEGSRPWRAARSNVKLREDRKILQEFVVAHCAWVDKLVAEHPHVLTSELALTDTALRTPLEEQVRVNTDLVETNRKLRDALREQIRKCDCDGTGFVQGDPDPGDPYESSPREHPCCDVVCVKSRALFGTTPVDRSE
jgi:hypothetical protein